MSNLALTQLTLYTSRTCPLGVSASEWLKQEGYAFVTVDFDTLDQSQQHSVRLALREFLQDDSAAIHLPHVAIGSQVLAVGFSPSIWQTTLRKQGGFS